MYRHIIKLFFFRLICDICWILEDIYDRFAVDNLFYPSFKWENLIIEELFFWGYKQAGKKYKLTKDDWQEYNKFLSSMEKKDV